MLYVMHELEYAWGWVGILRKKNQKNQNHFIAVWNIKQLQE